MGAGLPPITEVKRLELRPGDRVVVRLAREPEMAEVDHLRAIVREVLGDDHAVLVLGPSADLEVVSPGPELLEALRRYVRAHGGTGPGSVQRPLGSGR